MLFDCCVFVNCAVVFACGLLVVVVLLLLHVCVLLLSFACLVWFAYVAVLFLRVCWFTGLLVGVCCCCVLLLDVLALWGVFWFGVAFLCYVGAC